MTLREVVDEVGRNAVRFMMLTRRNDATLDFDFDLVKQQSRIIRCFMCNMPMPAFIRFCVMPRKLGSLRMICRPEPWECGCKFVECAEEIALAKVLGVYPRSLLAAATALEPHRLAFYLQDLAAAFMDCGHAARRNRLCGSFRTKIVN